MALYPTPHIDATPKDFAKTVLMPGDPLRAKFIAENFLEKCSALLSIWMGNDQIMMQTIPPLESFTIFCMVS